MKGCIDNYTAFLFFPIEENHFLYYFLCLFW
jgi:hypothetical protein